MIMISKGKAVDLLKHEADTHCLPEYKEAYTRAASIIACMPNEEAEPVKHGRWSKMFLYKADDGFQHSGRECSECGSIERPLTRHKFCPNCGARMDGDDNA